MDEESLKANVESGLKEMEKIILNESDPDLPDPFPFDENDPGFFRFKFEVALYQNSFFILTIN